MDVLEYEVGGSCAGDPFLAIRSSRGSSQPVGTGERRKGYGSETDLVIMAEVE